MGHVVEALKVSGGYALANKNVEVHLVLNADSPVELAEACPWIKKVYPISLKEIWKDGSRAKLIQRLPKVWDYIITDNRSTSFKPHWDENDLIRAYKVLNPLLMARIGKDYHDLLSKHADILAYVPNPKIKLTIPKKAKEFAKRYKHTGPAICIMLGGSAGDKQSLTIEMWLKICQALFKAIPNLKIYFTGITKSVGGRTHTADFNLGDVQYLVDSLPNAEATYNIGLWNQLALIQKINIFLSPHTGFAFLSPLIGTPWLELANCLWPAYVFNYEPFYSVLPECGSCPAKEEVTRGCCKLLSKGKKATCMTDKLLTKKIPEIVKATQLLLNPQFTYKKALNLHLNKLKNLPYDFSRFWFVDGIKSL
ncbi:hypothetical protein COV04_03065 [Candidatus Uhrbacteria bacterium CG10_big_fil_rev_8_21_14_0_10_48_11]|uniref:Glycosyl transferase n=1 Tax=Candidatus Uhrbacteria bacterium CG10_big_fil_rev_8_21_14_0_10_48_11 TaxID=1975037 RepID=A0A2M8LEM2_9BACT|nr:MAG: hypothetical protein COV04_03065 [Candidatus Uhrbacteria bacterium CG10_big_fil_rev_8_21_14_0_10_48_11]